MLGRRTYLLLFLLFLSFSPTVSIGARIITLEVTTNAHLTSRMERVLARYNFKVAHKTENSRRTEIVATNDRENHIPAEMILELGFHKTFIRIREPASKMDVVALQVYLQDSITREDYIRILSGIQDMGIHVSGARSQKHPHFFLRVPKDKIDILTRTLRENPLFDLYYVLGNSNSTEFFQDYKRNGVTTVEIAFANAGSHESILSNIPPHIAAVSVMNHQTAEQLEAEGEAAPQGGVTTITLPRKYAYVGAIIRSLEQFRGEQLIKIYPGDDYYEAKGDEDESFIIDPDSRRFVLEPRAGRIFEIALKLPNLEKLIENANNNFKTPRDVATLYAGLSAMVQKAFLLPIDVYGHDRGTNSQGGMTEFIYVEIPKRSMTREVMDEVLRDYHLYPLHNDGTPNRNEEIQGNGHSSCVDLLMPAPRTKPKPKP